jgi:hypothetical protein
VVSACEAKSVADSLAEPNKFLKNEDNPIVLIVD